MSMVDSIVVIRNGVNEILLESELEKMLMLGKQLKVKVGFDPTACDIHLGHSVLISKLRQFQDFGHEVIFIIGDFTASIGDPSGNSVVRLPLTRNEILENAKTYQEQIFKTLLYEKTTVLYNSEWLHKMTSKEIINLASSYTVARMLERDDFHKRYTENKPIAIHEFLYPLFQGYDSVAINADVEIGGNDQKFNLMMGRELQRHFGQKPQVVIMMPLLEGTDGVKKMSKSLGNYIGITDSPNEMFGKLMSISDDLMWRYFELLSTRYVHEICFWKEEVREMAINPRDIKIKLALEIVERFHTKKLAENAMEDFIARFANKVLPSNIVPNIVKIKNKEIKVIELLKLAGLVTSSSEARRLIKQSGIKIDGQKIEDYTLSVQTNDEHIYQVGKRRYAKIKVVF